MKISKAKSGQIKKKLGLGINPTAGSKNCHLITPEDFRRNAQRACLIMTFMFQHCPQVGHIIPSRKTSEVAEFKNIIAKCQIIYLVLSAMAGGEETSTQVTPTGSKQLGRAVSAW